MPFLVSLQCVLDFGWANPIRGSSDCISSTPECSSTLSYPFSIFSCAENKRKAQSVTTTLLCCYHLEVHCSTAVYNNDNPLVSTAALGDQYLNPGPPKYTAEMETTQPRHRITLCLQTVFRTFTVACWVTQKTMSLYQLHDSRYITHPQFLKHNITHSVLPAFHFVANTSKPKVN
jgi:hypothetical protein